MIQRAAEGDASLQSLKTIALSFLGAFLGIGAWLAIELSGAIPVPGSRPDNFEQRALDYVANNPNAAAEYVERQRASQVNEIARIVTARRADILEDPATPVGGNPQGDVSLVEFFDYNCPYCRRMAPVLTDIETNDPKLRILYKEWPILGPGSEFAARAALASRNQGKYAALHNALMLASGPANESSVLEVAAQVGLDVERLKVDMQAPEIKAVIERNRELALALRVTGTPSFVIGDQMLRGAADAAVIRRFISEARAKAAPRESATPP